MSAAFDQCYLGPSSGTRDKLYQRPLDRQFRTELVLYVPGNSPRTTNQYCLNQSRHSEGHALDYTWYVWTNLQHAIWKKRLISIWFLTQDANPHRLYTALSLPLISVTLRAMSGTKRAMIHFIANINVKP